MIPNFHPVIEGKVYRGGQPETPDDWAYLKERGIRTVLKLNLDIEGSDQGAIDAGMTVVKVEIPPMLADLDKLLRGVAVLETAELCPIFVHCREGKDRTGADIGIFRVIHCGWSCDDAYAEMLAHGYHEELVDLDWAWHRFKESQGNDEIRS